MPIYIRSHTYKFSLFCMHYLKRDQINALPTFGPYSPPPPLTKRLETQGIKALAHISMVKNLNKFWPLGEGGEMKDSNL